MTEPNVNPAPAAASSPSAGLFNEPSSQSAPEAKPELISFIPETYKDKPWAKEKTTDPDNFFKWVDNLETTVGKKSLDRPEKPDEYVFEPIPEFKDMPRAPEKEAVMKQLLHEAGVPKSMALKLQQGFDKLVYQEHTQMEEANKKLNDEFNNSVAKMFGEKKDTVLANSKKLLMENTSPEIRAKVETMDNDTLLVLASALDGITKKYIKEDGFTGGDAAVQSGSETYEQLSAKQRDLMKNPAFTNFMHPDHQKLMQENADLMARMRSISK